MCLSVLQIGLQLLSLFSLSGCKGQWSTFIFQALSEYYAHKTVQYISDEAISSYLGGIPTSLELTTEQWDLPNAWPPLQIIVIQGLTYTKDSSANNLAYELAKNWVYANHKGYLEAKEMFEKVRIRFVIIANTPSVQLMEEWLMILWVQLIIHTTYFYNLYSKDRLPS